MSDFGNEDAPEIPVTDGFGRVLSVVDGSETERGGFEPPKGCDTLNGLANRRFRPLSHLSRRPDALENAGTRIYQTSEGIVNPSLPRVSRMRCSRVPGFPLSAHSSWTSRSRGRPTIPSAGSWPRTPGPGRSLDPRTGRSSSSAPGLTAEELAGRVRRVFEGGRVFEADEFGTAEGGDLSSWVHFRFVSA